FCLQLIGQQIDTGEIAARPREAADKTEPDRVFADQEYDGNSRGRRLGRKRRGRASGRDNDANLTADQIVRELREAIDAILRPAINDGHVFTFGKADLFQALAECAETARHGIRRSAIEEPDHRHRWLLRARRDRPRGRRATDERDELAPPHSITSSASKSRLSEILMPSALAVFRLMTNSNLVGRTTGKSAGLVPLRMRPA